MTPRQIQNLIENLRVQTAANTISPDMLATILTQLNNGGEYNTNTIMIDSRPLLYCEVVNNKLYLRNFEYYDQLGFKPILFRYTRWRNRYRLKKKDMHGPHKKGWHANGLQGTLRINKDGQVLRTEKVINDFHNTDFNYIGDASVFVNNGRQQEGSSKVTWGRVQMDIAPSGHVRMIHLPFAIAYAKNNRLQAKGNKLSDLQSNLAPFFVRGQENWQHKVMWRFSR